MKGVIKIGLMATVLSAFVFAGCKKDDDNNQDIKKKRNVFVVIDTGGI